MKYYITQAGREFIGEAKKMGLLKKAGAIGTLCVGAACGDRDTTDRSQAHTTPGGKKAMSSYIMSVSDVSRDIVRGRRSDRPGTTFGSPKKDAEYLSKKVEPQLRRAYPGAALWRRK